MFSVFCQRVKMMAPCLNLCQMTKCVYCVKHTSLSNAPICYSSLFLNKCDAVIFFFFFSLFFHFFFISSENVFQQFQLSFSSSSISFGWNWIALRKCSLKKHKKRDCHLQSCHSLDCVCVCVWDQFSSLVEILFLS